MRAGIARRLPQSEAVVILVVAGRVIDAAVAILVAALLIFAALRGGGRANDGADHGALGVAADRLAKQRAASAADERAGGGPLLALGLRFAAGKGCGDKRCQDGLLDETRTPLKPRELTTD